MRPGMLGHDRVEDELGEVEHRDGQAGPRQAQAEADHEQARTRGIDEARQGRQVAQGAEARGEGSQGRAAIGHRPGP